MVWAIRHALIEDVDRALDWMERCLATDAPGQIGQSLHLPQLDLLRDTPRFRAVLDAIGAPASFAEVRGGDRRGPG